MKYPKFLLIFLLLAPLCEAQVITTIAGNGTRAECGDFGPATDACLGNPYYIICDRKGNLFFSDVFGNVVRKIDASGTIRTIAGNGSQGYNGDSIPATAAELFGPTGLALDTNGNIFIADGGNYRIRKVDTFGIITTIAGTGVRGYNGDHIPATAAKLTYMYSAAVDSRGRIYLNDSNKIRCIDQAGIITSIAGNGTIGHGGGDNGPATATLLMPHFLTTDKYNNIYFFDSGLTLRKIDTLGTIFTVAGARTVGFNGDGIAATTAQFGDPQQISVDDSGNIFIADSYNQRIRKINTSGIITTVAGDGSYGFSGDFGLATAAQLQRPSGVCTDSTGNIFIADCINNRIRKVDIKRKVSAITNIPTTEGVLEISPNPLVSADLELNVNCAAASKANIVIVNGLGQTVETLTISCNQKARIPFSHPPGVYLVRAQTREEEFTARFVKQ